MVWTCGTTWPSWTKWAPTGSAWSSTSATRATEDGVNPFVKADRARETLAQCGPRLIHLHLHDFLDRDHIAPMDGDLQWVEVFGALRDIDYQGQFMFEALLTPEGSMDRPE